MSRISCKSCRRLGESICGREKCAYKRRPFAPGKLDSERKHRSSQSEFGDQLRAKQKVRITYGLSEKQFSNYVKKAVASLGKNKEVTPELSLYRSLESRLDNVVFRAGLTTSRALARQAVNHGHITVNDRRVSIPSYAVKVGDVVKVREGSKSTTLFSSLEEKLEKVSSPVWMTLDPKKGEIKVSGQTREIEPLFDLQKVLEFYSR